MLLIGCYAQEASFAEFLPQFVWEFILMIGSLSKILRDFSSAEFNCSFAKFFEVRGRRRMETLGMFSCRSEAALLRR